MSGLPPYNISILLFFQNILYSLITDVYVVHIYLQPLQPFQSKTCPGMREVNYASVKTCLILSFCQHSVLQCGSRFRTQTKKNSDLPSLNQFSCFVLLSDPPFFVQTSYVISGFSVSQFVEYPLCYVIHCTKSRTSNLWEGIMVATMLLFIGNSK